MKIIDKNKDYYDYLQGVIGIDELAVYDRRGSVTNLAGKIIRDDNWSNVAYNTDWLFSDKADLVDYNHVIHHDKEGSFVEFYLLVGFRQHIMRVYRKEEKDGTIKLSYDHCGSKLIDRKTVNSKCPIIICGCYRGFWSGTDNITRLDSEDYAILNPILKNTFIPSFIKPEDIFNDVADYLLSIREKEIVDNRTDNQHIISSGFDIKTSFRNVK